MEPWRDSGDALAAGHVLVVADGPASGSTLDPRGELLLGREADAVGRLGDDPQLSRRHARLLREDGGALVVEDLGSTNGTLVNGVRIDEPRRLELGDVVQVGRTRLEVRPAPVREAETVRPAEPSAAPPPARGPTEAASVVSATPSALAGLPPPIEQLGAPSRIGRLEAFSPASAPAAPHAAAPPAAELLYAGRRIPIPAEGLTIGRAETNGVCIDSPSASRQHASIVAQDGRYFVSDLGSANGTELNGERLHSESRWLDPGDSIVVGGETVRFVTGSETRIGPVVAPLAGIRLVRFEGDRLALGRDPSNDVELPDPNVSRFHAELVRVDGTVELRDLGSVNGTRVDGRLVAREVLRPGSEVGIGPFRLVFDGEAFVQRDDRGVVRLAVRELTMTVKGKTILNRASLAIEPGELVAVIGESGSGKSTLIKALAGVTTPTAGTITANGEPIATRLTDLGYVPQDEIVHLDLTILEALRYAARLRLPRDSTAADIEGAVQRVLAELSLEEHGETRIGSLSGGQRKRVGLAVELLNRPSLLFLDEPTTGLDPGLETRMMELFRTLASEGTRAVSVVTHATKNLDLADKVCVMGRGGELSFFGPPAEAKDFFRVDSYDGIYTALDERPATEWRREFEAKVALERPAGQQDATAEVAAPPAAPARRRKPGPQTLVLARRYLKLMTRDRRNLLILVGQVPLLALAISLLFQRDVLGIPGRPIDAALLLFLMSTVAIWIGAIDASREIIKERPLATRERAVGVRIRSYLASKALVLFGLATVQTAILTAVVFLMRPLEEPPMTLLLVFGLLVLTAFVSVGLGLIVSALVSSEDQATSFIPLFLIPQLLFGGAIVTVAGMPEPVQSFTNAIFARWSFASIGSAADMNERLAAVPQNAFGPDFFAVEVWVGAAVLAGFLAGFFLLVGVLLRRRVE